MMIKIKDKYTLGIIASVLVNILINISDFIFYSIGINKYLKWQIAASVYFKPEDTQTVAALMVGALTDYSAVGIMGIAIVYLLYFTGTDYFWLKGLSIGTAGWIFAFGAILRTNIGRIDPIDAGTNIYHLAEHLLLGILIAWIIIKFGKNIFNKSSSLL